MFRWMMTLAGLLLEAATFAVEGSMAALIIVTGCLMSAGNAIVGSSLFSSVVNKVTGYDLPEALSDASSERIQDPWGR